jgi:hypothetical protein
VAEKENEQAQTQQAQEENEVQEKKKQIKYRINPYRKQVGRSSLPLSAYLLLIFSKIWGVDTMTCLFL